MNTPIEILQTIGERFQTAGGVKKVFGEPVVAEGKTVVPIARIRYGFGAGSGGKSEGSRIWRGERLPIPRRRRRRDTNRTG